MSGTDLLKELPKLTEAEQRRALELKAHIDALEAELNQLLRKPATPGKEIDLRARGISEEAAAELRARLKTFAEDWDRPEAAIYDEDPPRLCYTCALSELRPAYRQTATRARAST